MHLLLIALIAIPLIEIALFVVIGGALGLWPTLAVVVTTALAGSILLRQQGLKTLSDAQITMREGGVPVRQLMGGLFLFLAGAFLLTPGFLTDAIGLLLLVPTVRALAARFVLNWLARHGEIHTHATHASPAGRTTVIDAEFETVDDDQPHRSRGA